MTELNARITDIFEAYKVQRSALIESAKQMVKDLTTELFELNPAIHAIIWNQYAPYFNDGDPCYFSVNSPMFTNASTEEQLSEIYGEEYNGPDDDIFTIYSWNGSAAEVDGINVESLKSFESFITAHEMTDVLEEMFGEHVTVTATREGFTAEEYDHD
jgi:hypothetical protein